MAILVLRTPLSGGVRIPLVIFNFTRVGRGPKYLRGREIPSSAALHETSSKQNAEPREWRWWGSEEGPDQSGGGEGDFYLRRGELSQMSSRRLSYIDI